jgi:hypothetical protein
MPIVEAIGSPDLKDYHWTEIIATIETITQIPADVQLETREFKLGQLI